MAFKTYVNASAGAGVGGMAPITSPSGGKAIPGGWHPTVLYMIVLVAAEIFAVAWISKHL
jgi:hypothetical protein